MFKLSIDKNYYKPTLVKSGYNGNYIQYESKGDKILALTGYLALIEKYLRKLINYYKNKGSNETHIMHTRSDNEEFMNGSDTDEIIEGLFESFLQKYEENLQEKMKGSDFEFDGVNFLYYDFNKISINRGGSYIDSPQWLKNKKSTINPINNNYKCFQYAVTLALPKEIPVVFRNGSTYDYHFIIKELVKEFEGNFECLGENTEKYITFSVPLKKKDRK